jgi:arylsulfatase A-like enzyme
MKSKLHLSIAALALAGLAISAHAAEKKPNVLVLVADDLGWGELGVQGFAKDIPTPNIDSIANSGVRFTSGYVTGPYCSPTRAGLLTGRYQQRFGHEFNPGPAPDPEEKVGLSLAEKTIGDRFKAAGYRTGWFGKSHLGNAPEFHPNKRGFDEFYGFLGGAHTYLTVAGNGNDPVQHNGKPVEKLDYTTDAFAREAASFIEKNKAEPWFAYVPFNAVHGPLEAPERYATKFAHLSDPKRQKFAGLLAALDDGVGTILTKLRETGQEENTLVFFISDNGGPTAQITSSNGPLRGFKAQTWEGGVRVAWFVQWKGKIPAGKVDDRPVIQLDILPTALAAAGVPLEADTKVEGVNLLPYLNGEKTNAPHDALYWRFGQQIAIRKGDWKLVKAPGGSLQQPQQGGGRGGQLIGIASTDGAQLYNLKEDIGEQNNLAEKNPEKVKELAADWNKWNRFNVQPKWVPGNRRAPAVAVNTAAPAAAEAKPAAAPAAGTAAMVEAKGPWKSGDTLSKDEAPQIANRGLNVAAQIEATGPNGVIVAQGATGNGFALYLDQGKLAFAVRAKRQLSAVTSDKPLAPGSHKVEAKLAADGKVALFVDGQPVGEGKVEALIANQPAEGLTVGNDGKGAVGEYTAPNDFAGKVENVTVQTL